MKNKKSELTKKLKLLHLFDIKKSFIYPMIHDSLIQKGIDMLKNKNISVELYN